MEKKKSTCSPWSFLSQYIKCKIDTAKYPLNNVDIILPRTAPKIAGYIFIDWDKVIGANPGTSNKIPYMTEVENTSIPSSITIDNTMDNVLEKHYFRINGEWEDKNKIFSLSNYGWFELVLDNKIMILINVLIKLVVLWVLIEILKEIDVLKLMSNISNI